LEPIHEATNLLSGSSYPTQGDLRIAFTIIMEMLESKMDESPPTTQSLVASAMNCKLSDYWIHLNESSTISAIIDPSSKLDTFNESDMSNVRKTFEDKYKNYITTSSTAVLIEEEESSSRSYFRKKLKVSRNANNTTDILNNYLNSPADDVDALLWYKAREADPKYNALTLMAKDYLSIQATSVPSEQAFSIAKNTINPARNKLNPEKASACICLKSWIDNELITLHDN